MSKPENKTSFSNPDVLNRELAKDMEKEGICLRQFELSEAMARRRSKNWWERFLTVQRN